jgi:predicted nucleic acid-binding protein
MIVIDTEKLWAHIRAERTKAGLPIAAQDAWVAACAIRHNAALLTNNKADYASISDLQLA